MVAVKSPCLVGDGADVAADVADAGDAGPVADVTVVQDDVAAGGVPADVAWRGIIAVGHPGHGQPRISRAIFSTALRSLKSKVSGSLSMSARAGALSHSSAVMTVSPDHDMNRGAR